MPELHAIRQRPASQESEVPGHVAAQELQPLAALCGPGQSSLQVDARPFEMRAQRLARHERPQNVGGPFADAVHLGVADELLHREARLAPGLPRLRRLVAHPAEDDLGVLPEADRLLRAEGLGKGYLDPAVVPPLARQVTTR